MILLCWHCNRPVTIVEDGWICYSCGQHGENIEPVANWKDGCRENRPYIPKSMKATEFETDYSGQISCQNRTVTDDPMSRDWCKIHDRYCRYSELCVAQ